MRQYQLREWRMASIGGGDVDWDCESFFVVIHSDDTITLGRDENAQVMKGHISVTKARNVHLFGDDFSPNDRKLLEKRFADGIV